MRQIPPRSSEPHALSRRRLLEVALGAGLAVPIAGGLFLLTRRSVSSSDVTITYAAASPPSRALPASSPAAASTGAPAVAASGTPEPTSIELRPPQVGVGEAMQARARVPGAASALLRFRGIEVPMLLLPDGSFWAVVGAPLDQVPGPVTLSIAGRSPAGTVLGTSTQQVSVVPVTRPVDYLEASEATTAVLTADAQVRNDTIRAQQFATFDPTPVWKGLFIRPVAGEITTQFGQGRSINGGPVGGFHGGTDLAEPEGTPVKAAAPGRVCWTGAMPIHGNSLLIDHGGGVKSGYHHLSRIVGQAGDTVEAGKTIGLVGSTGFSTGPHLHWEVTVWGVNVDAMTWLTVPFGPTA